VIQVTKTKIVPCSIVQKMVLVICAMATVRVLITANVFVKVVTVGLVAKISNVNQIHVTAKVNATSQLDYVPATKDLVVMHVKD